MTIFYESSFISATAYVKTGSNINIAKNYREEVELLWPHRPMQDER